PQHHRAPASPGGDPSAGPAAGQAEPAVGTPAHPRRTPGPRPLPRRGNDPADPRRSRAHVRASPGFTYLAAVPGLSGVRDPGLRLLPRRHRVPQAPVRVLRDGDPDPAGTHPGITAHPTGAWT